MATILLAQPNIDVALGADTVVLGAFDALRKAGKARTDQFIGGIDGEPEAVAEIKTGGPFKTSVSLAFPIFGYALGYYAADWLEGKERSPSHRHSPAGVNAREPPLNTRWTWRIPEQFSATRRDENTISKCTETFATTVETDI